AQGVSRQDIVEAQAGSQAQSEALKKFIAEYTRRTGAQNEALVSNQTLHAQRGLIARFQEVMALMTLPRPGASASIKGALAYVAAGAKGAVTGDLAERAKLGEGLKQLVNHRVVSRGAIPV